MKFIREETALERREWVEQKIDNLAVGMIVTDIIGLFVSNIFQNSDWLGISETLA